MKKMTFILLAFNVFGCNAAYYVCGPEEETQDAPYYLRREELVLHKLWPVITDGDSTKIKQLLKATPDLVNTLSKSGYLPLGFAVIQRKTDVVRLLIDSGARINEEDVFGGTALYYAVIGKNSAMVELLVTEGADLNLPNKSGRTLLMQMGYSYPEMTTLLVSLGADPEIKNKKDHNKKAIDYIKTEERELYRQAIEEGLKQRGLVTTAMKEHLLPEISNIVNQYLYETPSEQEEKQAEDNKEKMQVDISSQQIINLPAQTNPRGNNRRFLAKITQKGSQKSEVEQLLTSPEQLSIRDTNGYTPLMLAIMVGREDLVDLLLTRIQAQPHPQEILDLLDNDGKSALDIAFKYKRDALAAKLLHAGASQGTNSQGT